MSFLFFLTLLSIVAFVSLFSFQYGGGLFFWDWMAGQLIVLNGIILVFCPPYRQRSLADIISSPLIKIIKGILAAAVLYGFFWLGHILFKEIWPGNLGFLREVYSLKQGSSSFRIGLWLGLVIGPGEEFLWRWYLQSEWERKVGPIKAFILVSFLYTMVHLPTKNFLLLLAAGSGGLFWGWLYLRYRSLLVNIVCHTLWDLAVFIFFPFG